MRGGLILVLFFFIIQLNLINASIDGTVFQIQETEEEDIFVPIDDADVKFYSGENSWDLQTDEEGKFYFNTTELFSEINNPEYFFDKVDVSKEGALLTSMFVDNNFSKNLDFKMIITTRKSIAGIRSTSSQQDFPLIVGEDYPDYVLYYYQIRQEKVPILLIHGWGNDADDGDNDWGALEDELVDQDYDVWRLQYWPANLSNRKNAGMISTAINNLLLGDYPSQDKLDVVSHSMGGLGTRGYIQDMGISSYGYPRYYLNNVRNYVIIASPMYGSYFANLVDTNFNFPPNFEAAILLKHLAGETEATNDLEVGSNFTFELNSLSINKDINYLTLAGNSRCIIPLVLCSTFDETTDTIVSLRSANLLKENVPLVILNKNHLNINGDQKTGKIIDYFIQGYSRSYIESELSGFNNEYYIDPTSTEDMSHITSTGWMILNLTNHQINLVDIALGKQGSLYYLTKNPRTNKWFYFYPETGEIDIYHYKNTLDSGYYNLYINGIETEQILDVGQGTVSLFDINLDEDNDNYDLERVGGTDCNDTNSNVNPSAIELCNGFDDNCDENVDEGFDVGDFCSMGIGECFSEGEKICSVNGLETECNAIQKQPSEEICDGKDNDCDGVIDEDCSIFSINLTINSPSKNLSEEKRVLLNLETTQQVDEITYEDLEDSRSRERRLCRDCNSYDKEKSFSEGFHNVLFRAYNEDEVIVEKNVSFFVDSKEPRISKTEPRRNKFTNGEEFYLKVREDNLKNISISFNPTIELDLNNCEKSRNYWECYFNLNLTDYNNQEIEYLFEVEDIVGNKDESRPTSVRVDTVLPLLNNPESFWYFEEGRYSNYIYFDMSITEKNFDEAVLSYDYRGKTKEKRLCSRLKEGICEKRFRIRDDYSNLKLIIRDEAGNEYLNLFI